MLETENCLKKESLKTPFAVQKKGQASGFNTELHHDLTFALERCFPIILNPAPVVERTSTKLGLLTLQQIQDHRDNSPLFCPAPRLGPAGKFANS